jgi:c(7)-type cytochrome triheme protein
MSTRVVTLAVLLACGFGLMFAAPGFAQPKSPPDYTFEGGKDSPGKVTFSHTEHLKTAEKCTACHTKIFPMKKPADHLTMEKMKAGEQCGACHNGKMEMGGKKVFGVEDKANCEKCHKKA